MDSRMTHTDGTVPHQQQDHSHNATGLDAGGEGDNGGNHHQHRDKHSVLKKVKEFTFKKIKDTLKPHSHGTHAHVDEGHEAIPDDDDMDEEGGDNEDEEIIHHDQDPQRRAPLVAVPSAGESARSYNEGEPKGSAAAAATACNPIRSGDEGSVKGLASVPSGPFSSGTGSGLPSPVLEDAAGTKLKEDPHAPKDKSDHDYSPSNYEAKVTDQDPQRRAPLVAVPSAGESARSYNEGEPKGSAAAAATACNPIRSGDEGSVKELASVPSGPFSSGTGSGLPSPVLEDAAGRKLKEDPHAPKDKSDHDYSPSNYEAKVTDQDPQRRAPLVAVPSAGESARSYNEGEPKGSAAAAETACNPIRSGDEGSVKGLASVPSGPFSSGTGSGLPSPVLEDAAGRKLKEDPHAPKDKSGHDYSPSNYEAKVTDEDPQRRAPLVAVPSGGSARSNNEGEPKGSAAAAAAATACNPIRSGDEGSVKGLARVPSGPFSSGTGSGLPSPVLEDAAGRKLKEDPHAPKDKSDHDYSPSNSEAKVTDQDPQRRAPLVAVPSAGESARSYNEGEPKGSAAAAETACNPIRSGDEGSVKGLASVPSGPFSSGTGSGLPSPVLEDAAGRKLKEDTHAPKDKSDHDYSPSNYEAKVTDPTASGGGDAGVSPIVKSMDKMNIYGDKEAAKREFPSAGSHDQFSPAPNKDIKATAQTAKPASMTVEYGKKIAATVAGTLSPAYNKVAEVGASAVSRVQGGTTETDESGIVNDKDKGVSVKAEADNSAAGAAAPAGAAGAPAIGGPSVVEKLKDAVGSWFGKPQPSLPYPVPSSTVAGATSEFSDSGEIGEEDAAAAEAAGEARAAN